jgi:hypothetical protein
MVDFSKYTNYKDNAGISSVVFGANSTVLEVELNEMQEIQKHMMHNIIKNIIGNGITDINKLIYEDGNIKLLDGCGIIAEGYYINCSNVRHPITNGVAYLQVWEATIDHNAKLNINGHIDNTESVSNWFIDRRASSETSRRRVIRYKISQSQDDSKINIPIAKVSNGLMTKLIKEVNLGKLYDRVDTIDTYDMRDVYGVEVDFETGMITRLANSIGKVGGSDFDDVRAFDRHRCLITETDGNVLSYINNDAYPHYYNQNTGLTTAAATALNGASVPSGSRVNIMVEQNKFYYKVVPVKIDKMDNYDESKGYHIRKVRYYISDTYKPGFKVHPAFIKTQKSGAKLEFDKIYIGAYKSVAYNADGLVNDQVYEDDGAELDLSSSGLTSVVGKVPVSGLYYDMTMANIRRLLTNMDENGFWRMKDITVMSMDILLFIIEYATLNAQSVLGRGYVDAIDKDNRFNWANITGSTASLGNKSSTPGSNNGLASISYRGEEDIYGGLLEFIEGYRADTPRSKWTNTLHPFGSYPTYDNVNFHQDLGLYGFINAFGYNYDHDWMFIPSEAVEDASLSRANDVIRSVGTYDGNGYVLAYGGNWSSGNSAGICNLRLVWDTKGVDYGSRIVYFPYKIGKSIT